MNLVEFAKQLWHNYDPLKDSKKEVLVSLPAGGEYVELFKITNVQMHGNPTGCAVIHIERLVNDVEGTGR